MLRFKDTRVVPRGGVYFFEVDGFMITAGSWPELLYRVRARGVPVTREVEAEIQDYMCRHLPENFCVGHTNKPRTRFVSLSQVKKATMDNVNRAELVDQGTARARADLCWKCPLHDRSLCTSCVGLVDWAHRWVGRRFLGSEYLGICSGDFTALQVTAWAANPKLLTDAPEHCWRKKENGDGDSNG